MVNRSILLLFVILLILSPIVYAENNVGTAEITEGRVIYETPEVETSGTIGSGNITHLENLTDVVITAPQDDDVLAYDTGSGNWINQAIDSILNLFNGWLYFDSGELRFNDTLLNATIDARATSTSSNDTWWNITGSQYIENRSNILDVNETALNNSIGIYGLNAGFNSTYNATYNALNLTYGKFWYNYTLVSGSYAYNQSLWLLNTFNASWYNHTILSYAYADSMALANNDSWLSTFNQTYANFAYNQTTQINSSFDYNMTIPSISYTDSAILGSNSSWLSTYNATYNTWSYNQSSWLLNTFNASWYNHTIPSYAYTDSAILSSNASWLSTYNATYNALNLTYGKFWYNYSLVSGSYDYNQSLWLLNTFNASWYNETIPSYAYTDSAILGSNDSWLSTYNETYATWAYNQTTEAVNQIGDNYLNLSGTNANQNINVTPYNITAADFSIPEMSGNFEFTLNHFFKDMTSAGRLVGGEIVAAGGTTVTISAGEGLFRILDDDHSQVKAYSWEQSDPINIPTDSIVYLGMDYNGGSITYINTTDGDTWFDLDTQFPLGTVINQGDVLHILNNPWWVGDGLTNIIERFQAEGWLERDDNLGGLILGYTGTRNPTMTEGVLWSRLTEHEIPAFDSTDGDDFNYYYRDGGGSWNVIADQTQWNITSWDDGSGTLDDIGNNQYAVIWVWINTDPAEIALMYPQATYSNPASAEAEEVPNTFPSMWYKGGVIAGRIIIKEGQDAPVEIQSAFTQVFTAAQAADHGNLAGLTDDDHLQYLLTNGSRTLSGNWDAGNWNITASRFNGFFNWIIGSASEEYLNFNGTTLQISNNVTKWLYNQTTQINSSYDYNMTSPAISYIDNALSLSNGSWSSTYNATYNALNLTYGKFWYNYSLVSGTGEYNYNQSLWLLNTFNSSWYNETIPSYAYTDSAILSSNSSWLSTYNETYVNYNYSEGDLYYNHTITSNETIYDTYGKWFYNMTDGNDGGNWNLTGSVLHPADLGKSIGIGANFNPSNVKLNIVVDNSSGTPAIAISTDMILQDTENPGGAYFSLIGLDNRASGINFGDIYDENVGGIVYSHSNDEMQFTVGSWTGMLLINSSGSMRIAGYEVNPTLYNQTAPAVLYTNTMALANNASWLSTYNATYDKWAYNQTAAASGISSAIANATYIKLQNATILGLINNGSYLSTYNATYASYNYSEGDLYYNHTIEAISYIDNALSLSNSSWLSTYNETYNALNLTYGKFWYNHTLVSGTGGNATFNQSLTDTLYAGIEWDYNQTIEANTYTDNALSLSNSSWLSTYNETYSNYAYNQSLWIYNTYNSDWLSTYNATYDALNSTYGKFWYNYTLISGSYDYNQSLWLLNTFNASWYNETIPSYAYTDSALLANNDSWLGTYNETYAALNSTYGSNWYNHTITANQTIYLTYNGLWSSTYNETYANFAYNQSSWLFDTYGKWWNNQTLGAITYTDNALSLSNASWLSTYNITYNTWAYNQSSWLVDTYGKFWYNYSLVSGVYNHTIPSYAYTDNALSLSNASWLSTYNATYTTWSYNQSSWLINNFNSSWYNHTIPSYAYTDSMALANNDSWSSTYNATYASYADVNSSQWDLKGNDIVNRNDGWVNITSNLSVGDVEIYDKGDDLIFR